MNLDAFALIAELSLGLLGFSGVAAAFGGREREFNYVERVRFFGIVVHSTTPLFRLPFRLRAFAHKCFAIPDVFGGCVHFCRNAYGAVLRTLADVHKARNDASASTEDWAVAVVWIHLFAAVSLYLWSILAGGAAAQLIVAFASHLAMGVFIFWRILMRAT